MTEKICKTPAKITISVLASLAIAFATLFAVPASEAHADNTDELMSQVKTLRGNISSAQSEYMSATQKVSEINAQKEALQAEIAELDAKLKLKKIELDDIVISEYKTPSMKSFFTAIVSANNIQEVIAGIEYANRYNAEKAAAIKEVADVENAKKQAAEDLESQAILAQQAADEASASQNVWRAELDKMRPQIEEIKRTYMAQADGKSGSSQLAAEIAYLENIENYTEEQMAIVRSAYSTGYAGGDRCEAWAEACLRNAGVSINRYIGAAQAAEALMVDSDVSKAPAGALIYGSGSGSMGAAYGHVGVVTLNANGELLIMDNEGSRSGRAVTLDEWTKWQTATSWITGTQGVIGWGYPPSMHLDPVEF